MSKYNYFFTSQEAQISPIGKKIIEYQNTFFLQIIHKYHTTSFSDIKLLEIGPGKGYFGKACIDKGITYQSIEENQGAVEQLHSKGLPAIQSSIPPIDTDQTYDVIFMNQVLEHMQSLDQVTQVMNDCQSKLNEGGLILLGCPDILTHKQHFYNDYTHTYPTSIVRLRRLLTDFQFMPVYDKYYTFFVKGYILTRIITIIAQKSKHLGLFDLIFQKKSDKIFSSLLPSLLIVGQKSSYEK